MTDQSNLPINLKVLQKTRGWTGMWVERVIYAYTGINWIEKILWIEIDSLSKGEGGCFAENKHFSELLQVHHISISRYISHLKELDLIEQLTSQDGRRYLRSNRKLFNELESLVSNLLNNPKQIANQSNTRIQIEDQKKESKDSLIVPGETTRKTKNRFERLSSIPALIVDLPKSPPNKEPPDYIQPATGEWAVLTSWHKLPKPAGRHAKLNTQTIKHAAYYIGQLKNGVFGNPARRQFNIELLNKHHIELRELSNRKFPIREICQAIDGPFSNMFKEGYWPREKSSLPRSLSDFFYNPRTQWSFFLQCVYDPPGLLRNPLVKDPHPDITAYLIEKGFSDLKNPTPADWRQYLEGMAGLGGCLKDINWNNQGAKQMFGYKGFGNFRNLVEQYVKWISGNADEHLQQPLKIPEQLRSRMLRSDFWMWKKFQESANLYWGKVFRSVPTEEEI